MATWLVVGAMDARIAMVNGKINNSKVSRTMDTNACKYSSTIFRVNKCASYATNTYTNHASLYSIGEAKECS